MKTNAVFSFWVMRDKGLVITDRQSAGKPIPYNLRTAGQDAIAGISPLDRSGFDTEQGRDGPLQGRFVPRRVANLANGRASSLPPSATVEIGLSPIPGGGPDGDLSGRVLKFLPPGWKVERATLLVNDVTPAGRTAGIGWSIVLFHLSYSPAIAVNRWAMSNPGTHRVIPIVSNLMPGAEGLAVARTRVGRIAQIRCSIFAPPLPFLWDHALKRSGSPFRATCLCPTRSRRPGVIADHHHSPATK